MADEGGHLDHLSLHTLGDADMSEARGLEDRQELAREHRVGIGVLVVEAVERGLAEAGGVEHENARGRLDAGQAPRLADGARAIGTGEGIVAAGVEHDEGDAGTARLEFANDAIDADRLVLDETFLADLGRQHVGRQQIVLARDRDAVAGVEEEDLVARLDPALELGERLGHGAASGIGRQARIEAHVLERHAHGRRIIDGLLQRRQLLVDVVTEDNGKLLGGLRVARAQGQQQNGDRSQKAHGPLRRGVSAMLGEAGGESSSLLPCTTRSVRLSTV